MMFDLQDENSSYLKHSIEIGEGVLILGAGASKTSLNAQNEEVKLATSLSAVFAKRATLPYQGETLSQVLSAVRGSFLSDVQIREILKTEYLGITPSKELNDIFKFCWRRLYTWNIDDSLENLSGNSVQRRRIYNGMVDSAVGYEGPLYLHTISLHGQISKPDHNFILTEEEYNKALSGGRHHWYQQAAQDYLAHTPIFVGSTLDEPILASQLERARREENSISGKAFLITPDELSPIKIAGLRNKGIVHVKATLADFVKWLFRVLPGGQAPKDILQAKGLLNSNVNLNELSSDDINAARALTPINLVDIKVKLHGLLPQGISDMGRRYLRGFPPSWLIAASSIPVMLSRSNDLARAMEESIEKGDRLFMVIGQAGSGKTTAVMMCLLRYIENNSDIPLYEIGDDIKNIGKVFDVLKKVHHGKCVVFVGDAFIYGDGFKQDLEHLTGHRITIISTARSSEWSEHLDRYLGAVSNQFVFQKFVEEDYAPLIERLVSYVPAPKFRQLSNSEQRKKLARSKSQLLIALREATESENFSDIITNEFGRLPDGDTKSLLIIVGVATLARVGVSLETAREAYNWCDPKRNFDAAINALSGIVSLNESLRLTARHELYVRHVIENVISAEEFGLAVSSLLTTYIKFTIPVIKSVNRKDGYLFKFLLNHKVIYEFCSRHGVVNLGRNIYEQFEIQFQLDGHYWLQFGLYLAATDEIEESLQMLKRSIEAYPQNDFAVHAYADLQLKAAKRRSNFDIISEKLIGEAVEALERQHSRLGLEMDEYPIVTMSLGHVGVFISHNKIKEARALASTYFKRLEDAVKANPADALLTAREVMFRYVTLGEWSTRGKSQPANRPRQRKRPRNI